MTPADLSAVRPESLPEVPPRIAQLWRDRGPEFLDLHRESLFEEIDRLHTLIDLGEEIVIDLREPADVEMNLHCHRHLQASASRRCTECDLPFCADCLVEIPSEPHERVCMRCALELAGIRVRHHH